MTDKNVQKDEKTSNSGHISWDAGVSYTNTIASWGRVTQIPSPPGAVSAPLLAVSNLHSGPGASVRAVYSASEDHRAFFGEHFEEAAERKGPAAFLERRGARDRGRGRLDPGVD